MMNHPILLRDIYYWNTGNAVQFENNNWQIKYTQ